MLRRPALHALVLTVVSASALPSLAYANCPNGEAHDASACSLDMSPATGWELTCDLTSRGDTTSATAYAVYEPVTTCVCDEEYCIWGTDASGTHFCYEQPEGTLAKLVILGGAGNDTIGYYEGVTAKQLMNGGQVSSFVSQAVGRGGNDTIYGSPETGSDFQEILDGGDGDDAIHGSNGADAIHGEDGSDTLWGDEGQDYINGNAGDDTIFGGRLLGYRRRPADGRRGQRRPLRGHQPGRRQRQRWGRHGHVPGLGGRADEQLRGPPGRRPGLPVTLSSLLLLLVACPGPGEEPGPGGAPRADFDAPADSAGDTAPEFDLDGDGWNGSEDCDDLDASVNPGASEVCNGLDDDCDGTIDGAAAVDAIAWYPDVDGDVYGDDTRAAWSCAQPSGHIVIRGDCDDADATVHPGAAETCDGVDTNCSGSEDDAADASTWLADDDGDGFGAWRLACDAPPVVVSVEGDCDDTRADAFPDATETCDGADQDCDGEVDDGAEDAAAWYGDRDGDGLGDPDLAERACAAPAGFVANASDCDDATPAVGVRTWYADADGDDYGAGAPVESCERPAGRGRFDGDCDDSDASVNPGASESCSATADANCDGRYGSGDGDGDGAPACEDCDDTDPSWIATEWHEDADGDGFGRAEVAATACYPALDEVADATDCDDGDAATFPGAHEVWYDGVDQACDGGTDWDADADGADAPEDCDDGDASVFPGAAEVCDNGVDEDCDGGGEACEVRGAVGLASADSRLRGSSTSDNVGQAVAAYADGSATYGRSIAIGASGYLTNSGAVYLDRTVSLGDDSLFTPDAMFHGEEAGDHAGLDVAAAGDVDGDGVEDVLVGARASSHFAEGSGSAYLVSGDAVGTFSLADATAKFAGEHTSDYAGDEVAGPGDMNGDGFADLLVGARNNDSGAHDGGAVYFWIGPVNGTYSLDNAEGIILGDVEDAYAGVVVGSGDVDGDGTPDVLLTADGGPGSGSVYGFSGPPSGVITLSAFDLTISPSGSQVSVGHQVDATVDEDGDGHADLLLGVAGDETYAETGGAAFILPGPLSGETDTSRASWGVYGEVELNAVGFSADWAGDVNGDGYEDVVIGTYDGDGGDPGTVGLFYGPLTGLGMFADADATIEGEHADDHAGYDVAGAGDIDADGFDDLLIGAPSFTLTYNYQGAAYLLFGGGM